MAIDDMILNFSSIDENSNCYLCPMKGTDRYSTLLFYAFTIEPLPSNENGLLLLIDVEGNFEGLNEGKFAAELFMADEWLIFAEYFADFQG